MSCPRCSDLTFNASTELETLRMAYFSLQHEVTELKKLLKTVNELSTIDKSKEE